MNGSRFVIHSEMDQSSATVLLTDIGFWYTNYGKLDLWCRRHQCRLRGMTVYLPNDQVLTLFVLRWS